MLHVKENTQPDPKRRAFLAATATGALAVGLSAGSRSLAQSATPAVEVLGLATDDVDRLTTTRAPDTGATAVCAHT